MQTQTDRRSRLAVFLARSDRPEVEKFYCPKCRNFIGELSGADITQISDTVTLQDFPGVSIRCSGTIEPGRKCHLWLIFMLGAR